jgi:GTPase SAR1 family protein
MPIRALSVSALLNIKYDTLELSEPWYQFVGVPEATGVWFVWGDSGNGKTSFMWQLAKELSRLYRVAYNSLEEGTAKTLQDTVKLVNLTHEERRRIIVLNEPMEEMILRLKKPKSPRVCIIDSLQYTFWNFQQYMAFRQMFPHKLLIFVSQAKGNKPQGRTAERVMFDASLKVWIEGYRAHNKGRYIGPTGTYDIWPEGALRYYGHSTPQQ